MELMDLIETFAVGEIPILMKDRRPEELGSGFGVKGDIKIDLLLSTSFKLSSWNFS